jgi:hypothetical protein
MQKIGVDFDGVVAYNPFRIIRWPISWWKRKIFKSNKISFFVPGNPAERFIWEIVHKSSIFPARGATLLSQMAIDKGIKFYLITGRFGFLKKDVYGWIKKYRMEKSFESICINENFEQPHEFKLRKIKELNLDYYIEDNLDIVKYLDKKTKTKIFWIYNILDKKYPFSNKFPYLEAALKNI